jgi:hypothetical protein
MLLGSIPVVSDQVCNFEKLLESAKIQKKCEILAVCHCM